MNGSVDSSVTVHVCTSSSRESLIDTVCKTLDSQIDAHLCFPNPVAKFKPPFYQKKYGNYYEGYLTLQMESDEKPCNPVMNYIGNVIANIEDSRLVGTMYKAYKAISQIPFPKTIL